MPSMPNYLPEVREQYEAFPYPPRNPNDEKKRLIVSTLSRMDSVSHHCFNGQQDFNDFRVLVAGGGTGDATIFWAEQLLNRGKSEVVYLDMSTESMRIAQKRAQVRNVDNISWINDSLLNIPGLDIGTFDFISCTGVLHHLDNPDEGLKALKKVLKPGGAMEIMVYGRYGREAIYQIQSAMRLICAQESNPRIKIKHTRELLKSLPENHWFNISRQYGWVYSDAEDSAGIYDLFLHARDRPFTIVEVHDWLERCGLKMASEPGTRYQQTHYLPETFIKDPGLLTKIKDYPAKIQQAIAENMSSKLTMHEFYAVEAGAGETVASLKDTNLVPYAGVGVFVPFDQLAKIASQQTEEVAITLDNHPSKPVVVLPVGTYIPALLRYIDGERTVSEVIAAVNEERSGADRQDILEDFTVLFTSLNRGHMMFLRDKSVAPYPSVKSYEDRVKALYA